MEAYLTKGDMELQLQDNGSLLTKGELTKGDMELQLQENRG